MEIKSNCVDEYLKICKNIKEYEVFEFEREESDEEVFDENLEVPLAYTTKGDNEEFEIQVTLNLEEKRVIKELTSTNNLITEYIEFKDWSEIVEFTEYMNFEELIMTDVDVDEISA